MGYSRSDESNKLYPLKIIRASFYEKRLTATVCTDDGHLSSRYAFPYSQCSLQFDTDGSNSLDKSLPMSIPSTVERGKEAERKDFVIWAPRWLLTKNSLFTHVIK